MKITLCQLLSVRLGLLLLHRQLQSFGRAVARDMPCGRNDVPLLQDHGRMVGSGERETRIERHGNGRLRSPELRSPDGPTAVRCFDSLVAHRPSAKSLG